jgi:hypothetical protein
MLKACLLEQVGEAKHMLKAYLLEQVGEAHVESLKQVEEGHVESLFARASERSTC